MKKRIKIFSGSVFMRYSLFNLLLVLSSNLVFSQECVYCPQEPISPTASNIGPYTEAAGSSSIAMGIYSTTTSEASNSISMGVWVKSVSPNNFVIGNGSNMTNYLVNHINKSLMIGFGSTKPTFFVGTSPSSVTTGRIGIGNVTAPQAKLHIRADAGEDAELLLEPTDEDQTARVRIGVDNSINARQGGHMHFETADDKAFVFHQGDINLEDIQSGIIMKSPDGSCWKGTLTNNGQLSFVLMETCPEETFTSAREGEEVKGRIFLNPNPARNNVEVRYDGEYQANLEYRLLNASGQVVLSGRFENNMGTIQTGSLPGGVYVVQVHRGGQALATEKLVIE